MKKKISLILLLVLLFSCMLVLANAQNIALSKPVRVSSTTPDDEYKVWGWCKSYINDGDVTTGWTSDVQVHKDAEAEEWVIIYLENLYMVDSVTIKPVGTGRDALEAFEVFVSTDGTTFRPVAKKEAGSFSPNQPVTVSFSPEIACAVKVKGTKLSLQGGDGYLMQIGELEITGESYMPTGGTLLMPAAVRYSSSYEQPSENWCGAMICDQNPATGWTSKQERYPSARYCNEWVELDLGDIYEINYLTIQESSHQYYPADFNISVSQNGEHYTFIGSYYDFTAHAGQKLYFLGQAQDARYIRFTCSKFGVPSVPVNEEGYMVQIAELNVYGKNRDLSRVHVKKPRLSMIKNERETIEPFYADGGDGAFSFVSSDPSVATVDEKGTICAVSEGFAEITVSGDRNDRTASVTVMVDPPKTGIFITAYWPPTPEHANGTQFNLMREALFDSWEGNDLIQTEAKVKNAAFFSYENEIGAFATLPGIGYTTDTFTEMGRKLKPYTNLPGICGVHMVDEPWEGDPFLPGYHAVRMTDTSLFCSLNFPPGYIYSSYDAFGEVLARWVRGTDEHGVLSFDDYPFTYNSTGVNEKQLLANFETVRKAALNNGRARTAFYAETTGVAPLFRVLNEKELRYHVNLALSYGIKQVKYFTYYLPVNREDEFHGAIVSDKGVPTQLYGIVQRINKTVRGLGTVLYNTDPLYVYQNGSFNCPQSSSIPGNFFVQPRNTNRCVVSLMKDRSTNRNYLMFVNKNYQSTASFSFTVTGVSSMQVVHPTMGSLEGTSDFSGGVLNFSLEPGGCVLYALNEGFDYNPAAPNQDVNLARGAIIRSLGTDQGDGWSISALNDGVLIETNASRGWKYDCAHEPKTALTFDLCSPKTFNCVELFPAGSGSSSGMGYPSSLTISVSDDAHVWTQVYHESDLSVPRSIALRYDFDSVTARYVKLTMGKATSLIALGEVGIYADGKTVPTHVTAYRENTDDTASGNLALGKPISIYSSSTTNDAWKPEHMVDGKTNDTNVPGYTSKVGYNNGEYDEWIVVDLGAVYDIDRAVLYPRPTGALFPTDYTVDISLSGDRYQTAVSVTGDTRTDFVVREHSFAPIRGRFVRIHGTKLKVEPGNGALLQIGELEVYGTPVPTAPVIVYQNDFSERIEPFTTHPNFENTGLCFNFAVQNETAVPIQSNSQIYFDPDFKNIDVMKLDMVLKAPGKEGNRSFYISLFDNAGTDWATNLDFLWLALKGNTLSLRNGAAWEGDCLSSVSIAPYSFDAPQNISLVSDIRTQKAELYLYTDNGEKILLAVIDASNTQNISLTSCVTQQTVSVSQVTRFATTDLKINIWAYEMQDGFVDDLQVYGYRTGAQNESHFISGLVSGTDKTPLTISKLLRTDTVELKLFNETETEGLAVIGFYDETGRLIAVHSKEASFRAGEATVEVALPETQMPIDSVRAFYWQKEAQLVPYGRSIADF